MTYIITYMNDELFKQVINSVSITLRNSDTYSWMKPIVAPELLDYIYQEEIKPMFDDGVIVNYRIDYKTGDIVIRPKATLRKIEVDLNDI